MTTGFDPAPPAERQYGRLLRCYPGAFRARFEDGMRDAFAHDHAAARARGRRAVLAFWAVTIWQAVLFGLAERRPAPGASMTFMNLVDWRDAYRSLKATPVITAVAVLSLALGTGANTALFSILNSMLYKSLPVRDPGQLVLLDDQAWTNPIWEQVRDRQDQFSAGAFAWCASRFDLSDSGQTEFVPGAWVSGGMFDVLGVPAERGRMLTRADDTPGGGAAGPVAVIGYDLWQRRFGGAPDIVGKTLTVQRTRFTIVGVMSRGFHGPDVGANLAVAAPIAAAELVDHGRSRLDGRTTWWLQIIARLRPGQSKEEAATILNASRAAVREATMPEKWRAQDKAHYLEDPWVFLPAATGVSNLRDTYRQPLTIVLAIVAVVLVIACANIANVLIARSTARRHDLSVRLALGASRWRLARQLLIESLAMSLAGAALGLLLARWGSALLVSQISSAAFLDLAPDWRVLGFTAGVAIATAVLFGVAPSFAMMAVSPQEALRERGRAVSDARFGLRNALVVAQVALSLALVVGAGLFLRTFSSLVNRPLGFDVDPLLVVSVNARQSKAPAAAQAALFERARQAVAAMPGVESASLSFTTPIGNTSWNTLIVLPDRPQLTERERAPWVNLVTPGWFATYGMRLVAGRDFTGDDRAGVPDVTVITRAFAKKYLAAGDPIGQRIVEEDGLKTKTYEVIGLVEDSTYRSIRAEMAPIMYRPLAQGGDDGPQGSVELTVRARGGAVADLAKPVAAAITALDPDLALTSRPLALQMRSAVRQERLVAMLSGFFGGLALLLAGIGLYGVTAYSVSRRRAEIGIRMALGARPERIVGMVIARTTWLVGAGVVAGSVISLWLVRYVGTLLYGVEARDPLTLVVAATVLAAVGLLAAWLPARRASRVDPTTALRAD